MGKNKVIKMVGFLSEVIIEGGMEKIMMEGETMSRARQLNKSEIGGVLTQIRP